MRDFQDLLMNAPVFITVQRGKERHLDLFNIFARKAIGGRDLTGRSPTEAFPELAEWVQRISDTVNSGVPAVGVDEPIALDWSATGKRETRYWTYVCQPLFAAEGAIEGSVLFAIDVTDDVLARTLSPNDRAWVEAALESVATPVIFADPATRRIFLANAAARDLSHGDLAAGRTLGQAMGLESEYFCTDAAGSRISAEELPGLRACRGEVMAPSELVWHTPFGVTHLICFAEVVPTTRSASPVLVLSLFDVSRARRIERELREVTTAREEFLMLASHELRTPLTVLKLQIQSLLRQEPESPGLAAVDRATSRMTAIVNQIIHSAEIGEQDVRLEPEELDLCALLDDVIARLRSEAKRVGSSVERVGPTKVRGFWDRLRLEQVFTNIVGNALRFGEGKPVRVECRDLDGHVSTSVTDQGIGIDPADQERIFQRFERAVSPQHFGGLGIGLWLARKIVLQMGGSISVRSALREGATFTVELPKTRAGEPRAHVM